MNAIPWQPSADLAVVQQRAQLLKSLRDYFQQRDVLEVETPILSQYPVCDPNIEVMQTSQQRYLQTSPEYPMKRLLAAGSGDIYQIARVFRQGEAGGRHNPEFTMLEWYRLGWDHQRLSHEVVDLLTIALGTKPVCYLTYRQAFMQSLQLDPLTASDVEISRCGCDVAGQDLALDRDGWLALLMSHRVEADFDPNCFTVVSEFPPSQAALSRLITDQQGQCVAARFEVFCGGMELANGYHELTDAYEQRQRFEQEVARAGLPDYDQHLIAALAAGLPDCAGVALGVDRLLMLLTQQSEIAAVISFDWHRA